MKSLVKIFLQEYHVYPGDQAVKTFHLIYKNSELIDFAFGVQTGLASVTANMAGIEALVHRRSRREDPIS